MAKITALTFDHEWTNNFGQMYDFNISFDDGRSGQVASKTNPPPYKVGDEVEVEVKRENEHGIVFKVSKGGFQNRPQGGGGQRASGTPQRGGWQGGSSSAIGQRTGNAVTNAIALINHGKVPLKNLEAVATRIAEVAGRIEAKLKAAEAPTPAPEPATRPAPAQQHPVQRAAQESNDNYGEPDGMRSTGNGNDDDDSLPF